jgi:hypothetical protein
MRVTLDDASTPTSPFFMIALAKNLPRYYPFPRGLMRAFMIALGLTPSQNPWERRALAKAHIKTLTTNLTTKRASFAYEKRCLMGEVFHPMSSWSWYSTSHKLKRYSALPGARSVNSRSQWRYSGIARQEFLDALFKMRY